jgi:hypothetical protein
MSRKFSAFSSIIRDQIIFYSAPNSDAFFAVNGRLAPKAVPRHSEPFRKKQIVNSGRAYLPPIFLTYRGVTRTAKRGSAEGLVTPSKQLADPTSTQSDFPDRHEGQCGHGQGTDYAYCEQQAVVFDVGKRDDGND